MKGRAIQFSREELAFIESLSVLPRAIIHAEFAEEFGRGDVHERNINALCKRYSWRSLENGQFHKGQVAHNRGLRRPPGWAPGRMRETQFTKGQPGWNWKPIGSERVIAGYAYTKVADERCVPWTRNWKPTHVLRWEAINGPIPSGHALKSLNGDRQNGDPTNWQLVSRSMLPRLNGGRGRKLAYDDAPAALKPTLMAVARIEHAVRIRRRAS